MILGCLLSAAAHAQSDPEVDRWIDDLGDGDYETREAAAKALRGLGAGCRAALVSALARQDTAADPEVRRRLLFILRELDWHAAWDAGGLDLARDHLARTAVPACSCGNAAPWAIGRIESEGLSRWFPSTRFYLAAWWCCQDETRPILRFAIQRAPDAVVELKSSGEGVADLAAWTEPPTTDAEIAELSGTIGSLLSASMRGDRVTVVPDPLAVQVVGRRGGRIATTIGERWVLEFGLDGRLVSCSGVVNGH